jgi:hypothetical protein
MSICAASGNIPGDLQHLAQLDTENALCYVLFVLGDSVRSDAELIGWAMASIGCTNGEGNRRTTRGRIQFENLCPHRFDETHRLVDRPVPDWMLVATMPPTLPLSTNGTARTFRRARKLGTPMFALRILWRTGGEKLATASGRTVNPRSLIETLTWEYQASGGNGLRL